MSTILYSDAFTTLAGMNKAHRDLRDRIIAAHGIDPGTRARLHPSALTLEVNIGGRWIPYTDSMPDARDRMRTQAHAATPSPCRLAHRLPKGLMAP